MSNRGSDFSTPKGIAAVIDTSVLVRAWLSPLTPNASLRLIALAGAAYDSFTSPAIFLELEEVLTQPRFGARSDQVRIWLDPIIRASRQVFPETVPGGGAGAVGGDVGDVPILKTAYAVDIVGGRSHGS